MNWFLLKRRQRAYRRAAGPVHDHYAGLRAEVDTQARRWQEQQAVPVQPEAQLNPFMFSFELKHAKSVDDVVSRYWAGT